MPFPSKDAPPFGPGLAPARGVLGRVRDALLRRVILGSMEFIVPALNEVRRTAGARPFARFTELYLAPPLVLHLTAEPFEYPRSDWPENMRRVGPGLWAPPAAQRPPWLDGERPIVLVTCSTEFQNDGALLEAALAAFGADSGVQLVCTTGGVDPASVKAPAGVVVERFVPHALVLPRASAVVCHGGMGITQRALAAGVPPCVVPWGRDQAEVGRRVEVCKAGVMLPRRKLNAARLRDAVERARARAEGARHVRDAFETAGGAERGATLLEELLRTGAPSGRA
jgi:MGT family glycosyltransferase